MAKTILDFIANGSSLKINDGETYTAILGESPSKGARSPTLWNAAFAEFHLPNKMYPFDVRADQLKGLVENLRADKSFWGGAVTMPLKQTIVPFLDDLEPEAKIIGAVNCIYRKGDRLIGSNTDGAGALKSLLDAMKLQDLSGKKILVLGMGGAGIAVATYMGRAVGQTGKLLLNNRDLKKATDLAAKLRTYVKVDVVSADALAACIPEVDVLINCTAVGFHGVKADSKGSYLLSPYSPLADFEGSVRLSSTSDIETTFVQESLRDISHNFSESFRRLATSKKSLVVFDIVYQPKVTPLLLQATTLGRTNINGLEMNLEQAVIAFCKVMTENYPKFKNESALVRSGMAKAAS